MGLQSTLPQEVEFTPIIVCTLFDSISFATNLGRKQQSWHKCRVMQADIFIR